MDNGLFLEGYRRPAAHERRKYEEDPQERAIMEGPRKWGSFFDRQLVLYLKGESRDEPAAIHENMSNYYSNWLIPHLDSTIQQRNALSNEKDAGGPVVNELNFHILNREMLPMWYHLLLPDYVHPYSQKTLHGMQTRLACVGADLVRQRLKSEKTAPHSPAYETLIGRTTEVDTAIVLLEMLKQGITSADQQEEKMPQLIVVPASSRFEAGYSNHGHAADFIVIDPQNKQSRGIQVKTSLNTAEVHHGPRTTYVDGYAMKYVTLIDGVNDLGNSQPNPRTLGTKIAPGLISLEYLHTRVSLKDTERNELLHGFKPEILRGKSIARELAKNNKPYLHTATQQVGARVLHDLYKQKSSPIESVSL